MSKLQGLTVSKAFALKTSVRFILDPPATATLRLPLGAYAEVVQAVVPGVVATVDYGVPRVATNPGGQPCIVQTVVWYTAYAVPIVKVRVTRLVGLPFAG